MLSAGRVLAVSLRYFYLLRGSPARIVGLFVWVLIDIILWGYITRYLNQTPGATLNFVPVLLGAVVLWDFLVRVKQGITMVFFEDVWLRNFVNIFASPLTVPEYLAGMTLSSIVTSFTALVLMLLLATGLFGLSFFTYGVALLPFLLVLFLFGIALGIFGSAIVLRYGSAAEWFVWPIPALISPFVGVFYPLATLPHWMQWVGYALPPSYVFEAMRAIAQGRMPEFNMLASAIILSLFYLLLAGWGFARIHAHAMHSGLLARYSAENAG